MALVFLMVIAASVGWRKRADLMLVLFCAAAYLICSAPTRPCCASAWTFPLLSGAACFPFAIWQLARVTLEDQTGIDSRAWAALAVLLTTAVMAAADYLAVPAGVRIAAAVANKFMAICLIAVTCWVAWRGWAGDLMEPRRRLRAWLLGYLGAYGAVVLVAEVYLFGQQAPAWLYMLNAAAIDATLLATLVYFVQLRPAALDSLFAAPAAAAAPPLRLDEPFLARLEALMEGEKLYRDPELSVKTLALRAGVPEYVLRRLVNERLGHRNFASYVNAYRLAEVEARLRDPQWARRPILTLALDAGFGSIGPFNRAFRERYGTTPTELRNAAMSAIKS